MTIRDALREGQQRLSHARPQAHIDTPLLDASVLLAQAVGTTRESIYARLPDRLDPISQSRFRHYLEQRLGGTPVSYICGHKEFYGLSFSVGPEVLVPRPDTEILVEAALEWAPRGGTLHDVCTGSGCVAISVQHERPDLRVSASDLSPATETVFRANCQCILQRDLPFVLADLMTGIDGPFDVISANPPYLTDRAVAAMKEDGWPEPAMALDGGGDGLDIIMALIIQAVDRLKPAGSLLVEADPEQMGPIVSAMEKSGFSEIGVLTDLAGRERVVRGTQGEVGQ